MLTDRPGMCRVQAGVQGPLPFTKRSHMPAKPLAPAGVYSYVNGAEKHPVLKIK